MKIKDLPAGTNLGTVKVRATGGQEGWWMSQWPKGVWLTKSRPEETGSKGLTPVFVEDLKETLEWEVLEQSDTKDQ